MGHSKSVATLVQTQRGFNARGKIFFDLFISALHLCLFSVTQMTVQTILEEYIIAGNHIQGLGFFAICEISEQLFKSKSWHRKCTVPLLTWVSHKNHVCILEREGEREKRPKKERAEPSQLDGKSSNKFVNFLKAATFQLYLAYDTLMFLHYKKRWLRMKTFSAQAECFFHVWQNWKINHLTEEGQF